MKRKAESEVFTETSSWIFFIVFLAILVIIAVAVKTNIFSFGDSNILAKIESIF